MLKNKCTVCAICTVVVGLSAIGWGVVGVLGATPTHSVLVRIAYVAVGVIGIGFLYYQIKPCPNCTKKNL